MAQPAKGPVILTWPATSSLDDGLVVPIPTLPLPKMLIFTPMFACVLVSGF